MEEAESSGVEESNSDKAREKRARLREKIMKEIRETEKTYQRHLELVIQYFEGPLHDLNIVPDHVIVTIFSNVRQIVSINQELLEHLEHASVGQSFLRMGPFLKLYSTYANNHERALGTMIEWEQKKPEFGAWRRRQEELPEMMGLKLNSLLITPVQRVPRYKLLLEDLLSNTEDTHEDFAAIKEAVKQISLVASHINEHIRQHDNFNKMLAIQKSLSGTGAPRILTPGRIFIKDGPLKKVSKKGGRSHERMFFLFSDILLYAKPKLVDQVLAGSYVCCCVFPLHHCVVDTVFGDNQSSGSLFTVTCKSESLLLYSDQKTVQAWITVLRRTIESLNVCRHSLRKPSSALQPLRRPGLIELKKQLKKKDPLKNAKRTPERSSHSPRSLKRVLAEANINCLTPRKQMNNIRRNLSPIFSDNDVNDSSTSVQLDTQSEKKKTPNRSNVYADKVTKSVGKSIQRRIAANLITRIRVLGSGRKQDKNKAVADKTVPLKKISSKTSYFSPEPKKQGPDCDIHEILDPNQPKWDIFDTALPDTSSVWRARLDTDPPNFHKPTVTARNKCNLKNGNESRQRPKSEISANTSRIWMNRPDSEISDDFNDSTQDVSHISMDDCDDVNPHVTHRSDASPELMRRSCRDPCSEIDSTSYSHSSRDFLTKYAFDEDGSPQRLTYHKQSESMLMPWKTQWSTPSPASSIGSERDIGQYRSPNEENEIPDSVLQPTEPDMMPEQWQSYTSYQESDMPSPPRIYKLDEDSDSDIGGTPPPVHPYFNFSKTCFDALEPRAFSTPQGNRSKAQTFWNLDI